MDGTSVIKLGFSNRTKLPARDTLLVIHSQRHKKDAYDIHTKPKKPPQNEDAMLLSRRKAYDELPKCGDILLLNRSVTRFEWTMWYWAVWCKWIYHGTFKKCWRYKINHDHFFYALCKDDIDELMKSRDHWWEAAFKSRVHTAQSLAHQFRRAVRRLKKSRARTVVTAYMRVCNAIGNNEAKTSVDNLKTSAKVILRSCIDEDIQDKVHAQTTPVRKLYGWILERESILDALHHSMLSLGEDIYTLEWCSNWMNFRMWFEDKGPGAVLFPMRGKFTCMYTTLKPSIFKKRTTRNHENFNPEEVVLSSIFGGDDQKCMNSCLTFADWSYLILLQWRYTNIGAIIKEDPNVSKLCFTNLGDETEASMQRYEADIQIISDLAKVDEQKYQEDVQKFHQNHEKPQLSLKARLKLNFGALRDDAEDEIHDHDENGADDEEVLTGGRRAMKELGLRTKSVRKTNRSGQSFQQTEIDCPWCGSYHSLGRCPQQRDLSRSAYIDRIVEEKGQKKNTGRKGCTQKIGKKW